MKKSIFILCLLWITSILLQAETAEQRSAHYNIKNGVSLKGYDPVSYFSHAPQKGSADFSHTQNGVTYHFSSAENREKFKASPEKYEPQYGGWCAYAFALGKEKVKINPRAYKIVDGKLYLFYRTIWANTLKRWNKKEDDPQIQKADASWETVISQ